MNGEVLERFGDIADGQGNSCWCRMMPNRPADRSGYAFPCAGLEPKVPPGSDRAHPTGVARQARHPSASCFPCWPARDRRAREDRKWNGAGIMRFRVSSRLRHSPRRPEWSVEAGARGTRLGRLLARDQAVRGLLAAEAAVDLSPRPPGGRRDGTSGIGRQD